MSKVTMNDAQVQSIQSDSDPYIEKLSDGEKTREMRRVVDQTRQDIKNQEILDKLLIQKEEKEEKEAQAWAKLGDALEKLKSGSNYSRMQMGSEDAMFELGMLCMAFGDALAKSSFWDGMRAILPEATQPFFDGMRQLYDTKIEPNKTAIFASLATGIIPSLMVIGADKLYTRNRVDGKHIWQIGRDPKNNNMPNFQYEAKFENGELVTSLAKNGVDLDPNARETQLFQAAMIGWLKSRGYEWVAAPAAAPGAPAPAPSGHFKKGTTVLTDTEFQDLNATGPSLTDFLDDKAKVHIEEAPEPPRSFTP
jgi:hypothetical protein